MYPPVVVHFIRGFLSPTETFVGNQVKCLNTYRPVVLCHHRRANAAYDLKDMYVVREREVGVNGFLEGFSYNLMRTLTRPAVARAAAWLRQFEPKLFHFHYGVDASFFLPLRRKFDVPAVVSFYGYDASSFPRAGAGLGRLYLRRIFDEMDLFLAMTEDMKEDIISLGAPAEKVHVHYHGVDVSRFRYDVRTYLQKSPCRVLSVGTLEPKKGQHHLLRAAISLRRQRPDLDIHLTFVGTGPLERELRNSVKKQGWEDRVTFAGHVPHADPALLSFYRQADVFVHFCTTQPDGDKEGIPGVIVEAMASGLPVISTYHAGIPETITDGTDGILLREDDFVGLVHSLEKLCTDPDLRLRLGRTAAKRALMDLNLKEKTRNLEMIYDSLLPRSGSSKVFSI